MKIVILDAYTVNPGDLNWDELAKLGELSVYERTKPEEILERCKGAEIILTNKVVLDSAMLNQLPRLLYIGVLATGIQCGGLGSGIKAECHRHEHSCIFHRQRGADDVRPLAQYLQQGAVVC